MNKGVVFMGMGFELVGLVIGAIYLGTHIEKYFQWPSGYGVGGMIILMTIGWFIHLIAMMKNFMKDNPSDKSSGSGPSN